MYVSLLRQPSATGYEISKTTGLARANVYQALASLEEKNAAQAVSTNPARYVAHAPKDVIGRIKRETESLCDSLTADLATLAPPPDPAAFWTVRGREQVIERVSSLVAEAGSRVALSLWAEDLEWLRTPLRQAYAANCQVVINLFGDAQLEFGEVYRHENPSMVVGEHLLTLSVDFQAAVIASLDEPAGAVYTRHPSLVYLVEKLIRDEAYLAAIYERFGPQLEVAYGPHLLKLRSGLLPAEQARQLLSVVGFGADESTAGEIIQGL